VQEEPYRAPAPPPPEPPDLEHLAIATVAKRARRARSVAAVGSLLAGLAASAAFYEAFWDFYGARQLAIPLKGLAIASLTLGLLPALLAGPRIATAWVRARRGGWVDALAEEHQLDREQLDEMTRSF